MNIFTKIYHSLPPSQNWKFWIFLALVIKGILFYFNLFEFQGLTDSYHNSFLLTTGDTASYLDPIDDLITKGEYLYDYRMPGYGFIYYISRFILDPSRALNLIGIIQLILSAISVYTLGLLCQNLFKSKAAFVCGFFIYLISIYTSIYDSYLLSESLCTSFLIFSFYFFTKNPLNQRELFFSGFFITWSIFLRPVIFSVFCMQLLFLLVKTYPVSVRSKFSSILYFSIAFIIIDGAWILRNEMKHHHFIPLQERSHYFDAANNYQPGLINFFQAFEGWEAGKELKEFLNNSNKVQAGNELFYPNNLYTSEFNIDSLKKLQKIIEELNNPLMDSGEKQSKTIFLKEKFLLYANSIKEEKPFVYYVESRFRATTRFLLQSGSTNLYNKQFDELSFIEKTIKLFYAFLYYIVLIGGFIGFIYLLLKGVKHKNRLFILLSISGFYLMLVYPIIFKAEERRYFVTAYPLFIIGMVPILLASLALLGKKNDWKEEK